MHPDTNSPNLKFQTHIPRWNKLNKMMKGWKDEHDDEETANYITS